MTVECFESGRILRLPSEEGSDHSCNVVEHETCVHTQNEMFKRSMLWKLLLWTSLKANKTLAGAATLTGFTEGVDWHIQPQKICSTSGRKRTQTNRKEKESASSSNVNHPNAALDTVPRELNGRFLLQPCAHSALALARYCARKPASSSSASCSSHAQPNYASGKSSLMAGVRTIG